MLILWTYVFRALTHNVTSPNAIFKTRLKKLAWDTCGSTIRTQNAVVNTLKNHISYETRLFFAWFLKTFSGVLWCKIIKDFPIWFAWSFNIGVIGVIKVWSGSLRLIYSNYHFIICFIVAQTSPQVSRNNLSKFCLLWTSRTSVYGEQEDVRRLLGM